MADHIRKQIRDALVTQLTGLATTGNHVFASRVRVLKDNQLPALIINTNDEDIQLGTFTDDESLERVLNVEIIAKAKLNDTVDDQLDQITKEVEAKLYSSNEVNTLGGLVKGLSLSTINVDFDDQAEKPIGQTRMIFNATYYNRANAPDVAI
jgi:hypothetical protein